MNEQREPLYIDDEKKLQPLLDAFKSRDFFGIDTEFVKLDTLFPILALVQLYDGENIYLVDIVTLSQSGKDLFWQGMIASKATFIFFSMHEDLEVINLSAGTLPKNIEDLQLMLPFFGNTSRIGLASVIKQFLDITILKDQTTSVWLNRPLSTDQIRYASLDVFYLIDLYKIFRQKLVALGNEIYYRQDIELQVGKILQPFEHERTYTKFIEPNMTLEQRARLRALVNYRYDTAVSKNVPINRILPNHLLSVLATKRTRNLAALNSYGVHYQSVKKYGADLLNIINNTDLELGDVFTGDTSRKSVMIEIGLQVESELQKFCSDHGIDKVAWGSKNLIKDLVTWLSCENRQGLFYPLILMSPWRSQVIINILEKQQPELAQLIRSNLKLSPA